MHPSTFLATFMAAVSLRAAQPFPNPPEPLVFLLKTQVLPGQDHKHFDGLYVAPYHTGAGLNDAVLIQGRPTGTAVSENGTVQFRLGTSFPWLLVNTHSPSDRPWQTVQINAEGIMSKGGSYSFDSDGLQWDSSSDCAGNDFGGWLACDGDHGQPQLYWLNQAIRYTQPSGCVKINVVPDYFVS